MSVRARFCFVLLWIVSVVIVAALASAQTLQFRSDPGPAISGSDLGFQPDGWQGKVRTGKLVVRINGQWVDVKITGGVGVLPAGQ
jgi:hypothetical protein